MAMNKTTDLITVGVITNVHGVKGLVKVKSFTQDPEALFTYNPVVNNAGVEVRLQRMGVSKGTHMVKIDGIVDRNQAEDLKGTEFFINRDQLDDLEEDEYYHKDIIGLNVVTTDNVQFGEVKDMHNYGAGDLIEIILSETGKSELFSFTIDIKEVDIEKGILILNPPSYIEGDADKNKGGKTNDA